MKWKLLLMILAVVVLVGCGKPDNLLEFKIKAHTQTNLALHLHPNLEIVIFGEKNHIPINTGIDAAGMSVVHTHDSTGKLHVEGPYPHQFILQDFFTIAGTHFNETCIYEFCNNETHEMTVFMNGQESDLFGEVPLNDKDQISIIFKEK